MSNENTNPGQHEHPALVATRNEGVLTVNTRTIVLMAIAFLGGGAGGTGLQFVGSQNVPNEVREELKEMQKTLVEIKQQMTTVSLKVDQTNDSVKRVDATLDDHEARLRKLEEKNRPSR